MIKKAFTLVEMVIVIVVLGIVAMIGTDIITHMYQGYIKSRVVNKLQTRTDQVLDMIAKRLSYRIKDTAVTSKKNGASRIYKKLSEVGITSDYDVLEWIGYDNEGMIGEWDGSNRYTGWSGFVDLDNASTNKTQIISLGSNFYEASRSIAALSYGTHSLGSSALIFKCSNNMEPKSYGFDGGSGSSIHKITAVNSNDRLSFQNATTPPSDICEQYYIAWTAYAIVPEGSDPNDFNLTLKYDYQPWDGEKYSDSTTKSALLAEHVSTFRYIQTGHTIRFKLCMRDPQTNYGFCKEKAVY